MVALPLCVSSIPARTGSTSAPFYSFGEPAISSEGSLGVFSYNGGMASDISKLADWTPEQIADGKRWVQAWKEAGPELERLRREELRSLNPRHAIALLCGPMDYTIPPRAPRATSGLVEQQRWFMKAADRRD